MRFTATLFIASLIAASCTNDRNDGREAAEPVAPATRNAPDPASDETQVESHAADVDGDVAEDSTERNEVDRNGDTLTPMDQGDSERDIDITATIRRRLMDDDDLSIDAKNAKIITVEGNVTLRGPVESESEKTLVESMARDVAGVGNVDNQLTVTGH